MGKGLSVLSVLAASLLALLILPMQFGPLERGIAAGLVVAAGILFVLRERRRAPDGTTVRAAGARAGADTRMLEVQVARLRRHLEETVESRRLIIDGFPDPAVFIDKEFRVSFMNRAARERFGGAADSPLPQSCYRLLYGRDEPCDPAVHPCALVTGGSCKEIHRTAGPDGAERVVEIRNTPFRDEDGEIAGVVEVIHDLNTQEKLALKLQRARADMEIARRARSEFVSTLSHEVRTPMNAVLGMADLLGRTELTRKQESYLGVIQSSGNLLLSLVDNLLGIAELDAGRLTLRDEEFSVAGMLESVLEIMGYQAYSRGIELAGCLRDNQVARIGGDRERVRQVLINLISNAIRFTSHGEVIVKAAVRKVQAGEARLSVSVMDSGSGIARQDLADIFRRFNRKDGDWAPGGRRGSGVGLSISKLLVEMMGGELTLSSEVGKGTTASFTIPVRLAERPDGAAATEPTMLGGRRILALETNASVGRVLSDCLEGMGARCRLITQHGEAEALLGDAAAAGTPYDCIVVDAGLGRRPGLELARRLRAREATRALPIVLLTSIAHPLEVGEISALGHTRCVNKPVLASELCKSLVRLLEMPEAAAQEAAAHPGDGKGLRVLVAEDNPISRRVLAGMLEFLGQKVDAVEDGPAVLAALEASDYDVILMDCQMPGLDGDEVTRRIRGGRDSGSAQPVIVAVTADVSADHRDRCLRAGMDEFIEKPVRLKALTGGLRRWRAKAAAAGPARSLDRSQILARLSERAGGDDDGALTAYIDLFVSDTAARLESVRAALERSDLETVRRQCHAMKGACMELGVAELTGRCDALGAASRDQRMDALPDALAELTREFERLRRVFDHDKSRLA